MHPRLFAWLAVSLIAGIAPTAAAQPVAPPPVEAPPIGAPAPSAISPAAPEDPRPREALTLCATRQVDKGIEVLGVLYAETRNPSFVFNQARCYQQNGQLENARERFREYLRIGKQEPPGDIKRAEGFIQELDQELARRTAIQDARPQERRYRGALRTTSIVLAATSVVAFGTGAVLSYSVKSKEKDLERKYGNDPVVDGSALSRDTSAGARLETAQFIAYGVGLAALAGAATTFGLSGWSFRDEPVAAAPVVSQQTIGGVMRVRF